MGERGTIGFLRLSMLLRRIKIWVITVHRAEIHLWKAPQPGIQSQSGILQGLLLELKDFLTVRQDLGRTEGEILGVHHGPPNLIRERTVSLRSFFQSLAENRLDGFSF